MIIPIRCQTCGRVLANMWEYYCKRIEELKTKDSKDQATTEDSLSFDTFKSKIVLDELGLDRMCCRRHMLGHVDLIDII